MSLPSTVAGSQQALREVGIAGKSGGASDEVQVSSEWMETCTNLELSSHAWVEVTHLGFIILTGDIYKHLVTCP